MRVGLEIALVMVLSVAALAACSSSPTPTPTPSTGVLEGQVIVEPLCPVEPCTNAPNPYLGRELILTMTGAPTIHVPLKADGSFHADIPPGLYNVELNDCPWMNCKDAFPGLVTIHANDGTTYAVTLDTGIRSADTEVGGFILVLKQVADGLEQIAASPSADEVNNVLSLIDKASTYAPYFASLTPDQADAVAKQYGDQVQQQALRISKAALPAAQASGDQRIADALKKIPSFAIATQTVTPTPQAATPIP